MQIKHGSEGQSGTGTEARSRAVMFSMVPVVCGDLHLKRKKRNTALSHLNVTLLKGQAHSNRE